MNPWTALLQPIRLRPGDPLPKPPKAPTWRMTGLLGARGAWFIGFSKRPDHMRTTAAHITAANERMIRRAAALSEPVAEHFGAEGK
jgi:hypothetical protein